jgi:hypothetical protein
MGLQLWKTQMMISVGFRENINASSTEILGCYELKQLKNHGLIKSAQNYQIKGNRLNCNGCRIQAK